jgi:hypothetical protein
MRILFERDLVIDMGAIKNERLAQWEQCNTAFMKMQLGLLGYLGRRPHAAKTRFADHFVLYGDQF